MTDEQKSNYERFVQAQLVIQDLERLGILTHEPVTISDESLRLLGSTPTIKRETTLRFEYSFTQYGVSFVRAVTKPVQHGSDR